jgi:chemotaxis protein CheD
MKKAIRIHIGGLHASRGSAIIETTLGSCVAVCLYDPLEQIGGMNHLNIARKFDKTVKYLYIQNVMATIC